MDLRYCIPNVAGRGAGLGNELVPWCRSLLAAQVLGARSLPPAFGLNRRRYGRHFGTPPWDWLSHRVLMKCLPLVDFSQQDFEQHGGGDVTRALESFAQAHRLHQRRAYVFTTSGLWGGMLHIEAAREQARSLLQLSRYAGRNLCLLRQRLDRSLPLVALHVRMGDFAAAMAPQAYRGRFNVSLPLAWYRHVAQSIYQQCDGAVQFLLVSDAPAQALTALTSGLPFVSSADLPDSDCSDLLALADADLLVCSVSSYSIWAAFLSDAPYLWFEPNLFAHPEGRLSIWGHEPAQAKADSPTQVAWARNKHSTVHRQRSWAIGMDGDVPRSVLDTMHLHHQGLGRPQQRALLRSSDLIRYGVVPPSNI
jgi:hypothetical protein